jgi:hypothetical protein
MKEHARLAWAERGRPVVSICRPAPTLPHLERPRLRVGTLQGWMTRIPAERVPPL